MSVTGTKSGSQERRKHTPENFMFGKLIGEGSFSTVFLVKEIGGNERELACKVCDKRQITKEKKTKYILSEKVSIEFFNPLSLPEITSTKSYNVCSIYFISTFILGNTCKIK